jgi:hypothetical protein
MSSMDNTIDKALAFLSHIRLVPASSAFQKVPARLEVDQCCTHEGNAKFMNFFADQHPWVIALKSVAFRFVNRSDACRRTRVMESLS